MIEPAEHSSGPASTRSADRTSWLGPPRVFSLVVAGSLLAISFLANFPAVDVPHAGLEEETYGLHFGIVSKYEHGWPLRYSRRDFFRDASDSPTPASAWRPWEGVHEWSTLRLLADLLLWGLVIAAATVAAQYWRSRRRAVWQLDLRDLLLLTGAAAILFGWLAASRAEYLREKSLLAQFRERNGNPQAQHEVAASVPAWWPDWLQGRYREAFNRTVFYRSSGDTDLACQHRRVVTLRETAYHRGFPKHLRQMTGLEALDLSYTRLPYFDATRQATLLRDLAPLPNLRGINLYSTNATDSDMAWLAACGRLEVIVLSDTNIGDYGLKQLSMLPRLRKLAVSSHRISDEGCRSIARIATLEELSLASRNIHDTGVVELARLPNLRKLGLSADASQAAFAALQRQMPNCRVKASGYGRAD